MLLVNGEKLDKVDGRSAFAKAYSRAIKGLKDKFGNNIIIDFPPEAITWLDMGNGKRKREYPQGFMLQTKRIYDKGGDSFEVIYYETSRVDNNGITQYKPKFFDFRSKQTINLNKQKDLAFFLVFVSPFCGFLMDKELRSLQNDLHAARDQYIVFDENGMAESEMEIAEKVSEAQALIASQSMGLSIDNLTSIGVAYGALNPGNQNVITPALVRKRMNEFVLRKDSKGKYDVTLIDQFLEDVNLPEVIEVKAFVKELIHKNIIGIEKNGRVSEYCVYDKNGKVISSLCRVNEFDVPENSIIDHLLENPEHVKQLKEVIAKRD